MQGPICIIANTGAGRKKAAKLHALLDPMIERIGGQPELRVIREGEDIAAAARAARAGGFATIIAAGGDGTVCAVAAELVGTDIAMGVLPMGTFNFFSRSLGFPEDPQEAVTALTEAEPRRIAVGEVNGQIFLNNASLGLYPAILESREAIYSRWGRSRMAAYWSVIRTIADFRRPSVMKVTIDGEARRLRTPMVFVAANGYQLDQFGLPGTDCLDRGQFAVFLAPDCSRGQLVRFAARLALRKARSETDFELLCGTEIVIETRKLRRTIARDGERGKMTGPLRFRMLPGALKVLAPVALAETSASVANRIAAEGPDAASGAAA
ncbi:diacylglycerol/lipid kinase family protein [Frigidibacter mobilis]|nr:diacylglycerol kinase family protein [Frigidibacter mobilis]